MRFAIVRGKDLTIRRVRQYLPANYDVMVPFSGSPDVDDLTSFMLIAGTDNAGWTLDDYVIPRLASGLIVCTELIQGEDRS